MIEVKNITIMNRFNLNLLVGENRNTAIISITDKSTPFVHIDEVVRTTASSILFIRFNDNEEGEEGCITDLDAELIASFIKNNTDKHLIISCDGGVSRSTAVGAAALKLMYDNDMEIWSNGMTCPNKTVYKKVMKALGIEIDAEDLKAKEEVNIKAWKIRQGINN